jgi:hypothetical protein
MIRTWVVSLCIVTLGGGYAGQAQTTQSTDKQKASAIQIAASNATTQQGTQAAQQGNTQLLSQSAIQKLQGKSDTTGTYDRQRPMHVAVFYVRNLLTDSTKKSSEAIDSYFDLKKAYHPSPKDTVAFKLNDVVVLYVRDLRLALRRYKRHKEDLRLYINDVPLPMAPEHVDTLSNPSVSLVRFRLVRNSTTEPIWQIFYRIADRLDRHNASFNIGVEDGQFGIAYRPINLLLIDKRLLWVGAGFLLLLFGSCWWLIGRSNFIRTDDSLLIPFREGGAQSEGSVKAPLSISRLYKKVPFSLAKTQTAFWTILIAGAYLMITAVTTALPPIPNGLLGLLGISIANGVLSRLLNQSRSDTSAAITKQTVDNTQESKGWWYDVLNENAGVSLSRLQFLVFNAIAGLYFVYYVWTRWAFYDFGSDILALISISSAGFLANKNLENNSKDKDNKPGASGGSSYTETTDAGTGTSPTPLGGGGIAAASAGTTTASVTTTPATTPMSTDTPSPATKSIVPATGSQDMTPSLSYQGTAAAVGPTTAPVVPPPASQPTPLEQWRQNLQRFLRFPVRYNSDPTRDIFGNPGPVVNDCTLEVVIVATLRGGLDLQATVQCNRDPFPSGDVVFLLHPTYDQRALTVPLHEGEAHLRFFSVGCYTLIAMLDAGKTILSFDLRNVPGAPSSFLAR